MGFIDTHFHLDFYRDHKKWYEYINQINQYTICVTNSPGVYYSCKKMYPETKYLKFALGYNPKAIIHEHFDKRLFNHMLSETKYIGEVGLDFTGKLKSKQKEQVSCFDYICAAVSDAQVLSIHSKNAESEVLDTLKKNNVRRAILHWYTGDLKTLEKLLKCGYYFSINANMIKSVKGQTIIQNIPIDRILVESDGPFTKVDSYTYTPSKLQGIYSQLGDFLKCENIEKIIWNNFKKLME